MTTAKTLKVYQYQDYDGEKFYSETQRDGYERVLTIAAPEGYVLIKGDGFPIYLIRDSLEPTERFILDCDYRGPFIKDEKKIYLEVIK